MPKPLQTLKIGLAIWLFTWISYSAVAQTLALISQPVIQPGFSEAKVPSRLSAQERTSLRQLLSSLETTYGVRFNYKASLVRQITVESTPVSAFSNQLNQRLNDLLAPVNLQCRPIGVKSFVIVPKSSPLSAASAPQPTAGLTLQPFVANDLISAADRVLSGRVIDGNTGQGLPGVNVVLKGSSRGSTTNAEGNYNITIPTQAGEGIILIFSFIGYQSQEIVVGSRSTVDVTMNVDNKSLNEVVVVGYGTQKKSDVTGSVATINAEKLKSQPNQSVDQALTGQIAGVQVVQPSGGPGAGTSVRVRGIGSVSSGSEPLYVVDGFPLQGSFNQSVNPLVTINPQDIETITVLKDASATAIYGSRGSNGVVIITTKRGKAGKTRIEVDAYTGVQNLERRVNLMNAAEFAQFSTDQRNGRYLYTYGGNPNDTNEQRRQRTNDLGVQIPSIFGNGVDTDWQSELFQQAPIHNLQLSASGGTEKSQFAISGNYFKQGGIVPNTDLTRFSLRTNLDAKLTERLRVGISLTPNVRDQKLLEVEGHPAGGIILNTLTYLPMSPVYNPNGSYFAQNQPRNDNFAAYENPLVMARNENRRLLEYRFLTTTYAELEILKSLTLKASLGADLIASREDRFKASTIGGPGQPAPTIPSGFSNNSNSYNWLNEYTLTYNRTFSKHTLTALGGYTVQKAKFYGTAVAADRFPNDLVTTLNGGQVTAGSTSQEEWALLSYLARINYAYQDKYLLTVNFRRDGSSRFGSSTRWGNFPSVALGWRLAEEGFMKAVPVISDLKLRTSYGQNGNNFISNYGAIGLLTASNYILGTGTGVVTNGLVPSSISNPNLTWEKANQVDVGLEVGLFNNRVFLTAEYYNKQSSGLLLNVPVPSISGLTNTLQNIGKLRNTGWEFSLNTRNLTKTLTWTTDVNIAFNRNKVLALGPKGDPIRSSSDIAETHITQIGSPLSQFYGYVVDGVFNNQAEIDKGPTWAAPVVTVPGVFRFKDINGPNGVPDGKIDPNDRTVIGSPQPKFTFGLTNSFSYKGFDLTVLLQGSYGNDVMYLLRRFNITSVFNGDRSLLNRWRSEQNPGDGKTPAAWVSFYGNSNQISSYNIADGSYLRIRNLSLGYRLPKSLTDRLSLESIRVYTNVQNLHTFTNYPGYNPEVNRSYGNPLLQGIDYGAYPLARTITFGLTVTF